MTDYADLVGRLKSSTNDKDNMPRMSTEFVRTLRVFDVSEAADAIETLVRERDEWENMRDDAVQAIETVKTLRARVETAERERDEARAERDNEKAAGGPTPDNGRPLVEGADKEKSKAAAPAADHSPPKEPPND